MSNPWQDPQQSQGQSYDNGAGQGSNPNNPYAQPSGNVPEAPGQGATGQGQWGGASSYQQPNQSYQQVSNPYQQGAQPYQQGAQPYQQSGQPYPQGAQQQPYQQGMQPAPYPAGQFPGGFPEPEPSKGTAIAAAVLSFLGVFAAAVGLVLLVVLMAAIQSLSDENRAKIPGWFGAYVTGSVILSIIMAAVLLVGGIMLLRQNKTGRTLIIAGCAIAILSQFLGIAFSIAVENSLSDDSAGSAGSGMFGAILGIIFPIVTMVLALLPSTTKWLDSRKVS